MVTRVLPVDYPLAGKGSSIAAELRASATVAAGAVRGQTDSGALTATASTTATAVVDLAASATSTTTATITAGASVAAPTDISSLIQVFSGTFATGILDVPSYDQAYSVTLSDTLFASNVYTRGVLTRLPTPSTPNAAHWLSFTVTILSRVRRFSFDPMATNWKITGTVIEPDSAIGSNATITLTWDTAAQGWHVSAYSGDTAIREHGPSLTTSGVMIYGSPEARALADWADRATAAVDAIATVPPSTLTVLASHRTTVDLLSSSSSLPEALFARGVHDPTYGSGLLGLYSDPYVNAYAHQWGRTMLHELGHAWDKWALASLGYPWGIDPVIGTPNAYDSVRTDYEDGTYDITDYTPTDYTVNYWSADGSTLLFYTVQPRPQFSHLSNERDFMDLFDAAGAGTADYYFSQVSEFIPQQFMLCWVAHDPPAALGATEFNNLGGNSAWNADFRALCESFGVLPSGW